MTFRHEDGRPGHLRRAWTWLIAAAFVVGSTSGNTFAQDTLLPGEVSGHVRADRVNCYRLSAPPGSQWAVTMRGNFPMILEVGTGACNAFARNGVSDRVQWQWAFNRNPTPERLEFVAGGGEYTIRAGSNGVEGGNYTLTLERLNGSPPRLRLPASGTLGPWLTPGWTPASVSSEPANAGEGLRPRTVFKDCEDVCPELVVVAAGSFTMGSPDEEAGRHSSEGPRHPVAFGAPFAIGRHEVTFAEYDACVADGGCLHRPNDQGWGRGRRPVVDVSWNDAQEYVAWLSEKTGHRYQLPSESEWEYAARAGTDTPWHTGRAILTDDANILNAFQKTVTVGAYPPNAFGLHDVHGNAAEWVLDCLDTGYVGVPNDGSAATGGNCAQQRIVRGGTFAGEPGDVRSARRASGPQTSRYTGVGFRVTRAL